MGEEGGFLPLCPFYYFGGSRARVPAVIFAVYGVYCALRGILLSF